MPSEIDGPNHGAESMFEVMFDTRPGGPHRTLRFGPSLARSFLSTIIIVLGNTWLKDVDGRYSARKGYLDIFTPTRHRSRCWNRADPSICAPFMKPLRVIKASARELWKPYEVAKLTAG
jgi:hypothetical protein